MHQEQRLTRARDFEAARRHGRSWSDGLLVLVARPNNLDVTRFGFSVSKRVGGSVVRNKVKRRLREVARLASVREGWDVVIIARKEAPGADFQGLKRSMATLLRRAGVLDTSTKRPSRALDTECSAP